MLSIKDIGLLKQLVKHCNRIIDKMKNVSLKSFLSNADLLDVVSFHTFQIGELAGKFSDDFVKKHKEIEWQNMKSTRNHIVHGYSTIDYDAVYKTAKEDVVTLKQQIIDIAAKEKVEI